MVHGGFLAISGLLKSFLMLAKAALRFSMPPQPAATVAREVVAIKKRCLSLDELKIRYHYFMPLNEKDDLHEPKLTFQLLEGDHGETTFEGLNIAYCSYDQLGMKVNGFRIGKFAYVTDILDYREDIYKILKGAETLVISGRRWKKSKAHISLEEGIEISKKIGAKKTYFTHISHEIEHDETSERLPDGFFLAYDGLEIEA